MARKGKVDVVKRSKAKVAEKKPVEEEKVEMEVDEPVSGDKVELASSDEESEVEFAGAGDSNDSDEEGDEGRPSESDGADSSDEEMDAGEDHFKSNRPLVLLKPQDRDALISKTKKNRNKTADGSSKPGVVYLGRIPHGFYEKEMRAYFSQFGDVTRLRLSRNKKTGKSKHYAFIEFTSEETAKIVAETMNDYLMFNHLLKCKFVPQEKVHPDTFNGANKKFKVIPWQKVQRERHNKPKSEEQHNKLVQNLIKKEKSKKRRLEELGIEYEFAGYEALVESDGKGSNVDGESTKKSTEATKAKKEASTVEKPSVSEPKSAKAKPATVKSVSEKSVAPKPKKAKTEQAVKPSATAVETRKRTESANDKVVAKTGETKKGKAAGGSTKANGTDATPKGKSTATKAGKPTRKRNVRDV